MDKQIYAYGSSLCHHGIKGQEWGVQNGPPYPLNPTKDYSKAEQKANVNHLRKVYKSEKGYKNLSNYGTAITKVSKDKIIQDQVNYLEPYRKSYLDSIYQIRNNKNGGITNEQAQNYYKSVEDYSKALKQVTDNVVGQYGNTKIRTAGISPLGVKITTYGGDMRNIIQESINKAVTDAYKFEGDYPEVMERLLYK